MAKKILIPPLANGRNVKCESNITIADNLLVHQSLLYKEIYLSLSKLIKYAI